MILAIDRFRWVRQEEDGAGYGQWELPPGAIGALDCRPLHECAMRDEYGTRPCSVFVFAGEATMDGEAVVLGNGRADEIKPSARLRAAWQSLMGRKPDGETLADWLFDALTAKADPLCQDGPAPLMPGRDRCLRVTLPGQGTVKWAKHRWGDVYTDGIRARLHSLFPAIEAEGETMTRKILDFYAEKFRLQRDGQWKELIPLAKRNKIESLLPHETSFTESWPTNSSTLSTGQDQPWTEVLNDSEVSGGLLRGVIGNTAKRNRCDTALSGADHYCQATITHNSGGSTARNNEVSVRFDSGADTSFSYRIVGLNGGESIQKCVTGTFTSLTSGARTNSLDTIYLEISGSNLQAKYAGVNSLSVTDSSIAGGVRIGAGGNGSGATWGLDSIVAEDLAAGTGQPAMRRYGGVVYGRPSQIDRKGVIVF